MLFNRHFFVGFMVYEIPIGTLYIVRILVLPYSITTYSKIEIHNYLVQYQRSYRG